MKSLKECLTEININESSDNSFELKIVRDPVKITIDIESFHVEGDIDDIDYGEYDYELTNQSQKNNFFELWDEVVDNNIDDFEFKTDVELYICDEYNNEASFYYEATYKVGYPSRTPISISSSTTDNIGLSQKNIKDIITKVHNSILHGDYAADEVAKELYDYLH